MRSKTIGLLVVIASVVAPPATAAPIPLFNTGVDATGTILSVGSSDPHWTIIAGPGIVAPQSAVVVNDQSASGRYGQNPNSRWIWVNASGMAGTFSPYTIRLTFDLTGFIPSTATISGSWGVDNDGSILLNGSTPVGSGTFSLDGGDVFENYNQFHGFTITGGFVSGINTLDFLSTDLGGVGGLNVNSLVGTATPGAAVPEPSSLVLGCLALGSLGLRRIGVNLFLFKVN